MSGQGATGGATGRRVPAWAASGGMWLTGWADEPVDPVGDPLGLAAEAATAIAAATGVEVDVAVALFGRAALLGLRRHGRASAAGSCRLLRARDAWLCVNLARDDDVASVAAIVGAPAPGDPWIALEAAASSRRAVDLVEAATIVGVPAAVLGEAQGARPAVMVHRAGASDPAALPGRPLVVDLSAMWAGPLCAWVLGAAGCQVVKVESTRRPDGARAGDPRFYEWLHHGHDSTTLDLGSGDGRDRLRALVARADVVIEASRPRALQHLGVDARATVAGRAGRTWVRITGYGSDASAAERVAFGDDAAVAGGLVGMDGSGSPVFCGDAIADPLTGLVAAAAACAAIAAGGGALVDVALAAVAAEAAGRPAPAPTPRGVDVAAPHHPALDRDGRGDGRGRGRQRLSATGVTSHDTTVEPPSA